MGKSIMSKFSFVLNGFRAIIVFGFLFFIIINYNTTACAVQGNIDNTKTSAFDRQVQAAVKSIRQGDLDNAKDMRQRLLKDEKCNTSDFLSGMRKVGWEYYCADNWDEAVKTCRMGLDRNPDHPKAVFLQYQIVQTMLSKGDMEQADSEIQNLLTRYGKFKDAPGLAYRLGNEYYKKNNLQGAVNVYEQLLSEFPDHKLAPSIRGMEVKSYEVMAKSYRRRNLTDKAIAAYKIVLERFPDHKQVPSIQDAIVETYADAGDLVRAQQALQTDIEKYPHRDGLYRVITRVAVETARDGDTATAMELADEIFDQNPEKTGHKLFGYTTQARVYVHQGEDAEAAAIVDKTMETFKDNQYALSYHLFGVGEEYYNLAQKASQNQEPDEASRYYQLAIDNWELLDFDILKDRKSLRAYYTLADCYRKQGGFQKSNELFKKVVTDFNNETLACQALLSMAKNFSDMEDNGISSASPVYLVDPNEIDAYETMGDDNSELLSLNSELDVYKLLVDKYPETSAGSLAKCILASQNN